MDVLQSDEALREAVGEGNGGGGGEDGGVWYSRAAELLLNVD